MSRDYRDLVIADFAAEVIELRAELLIARHQRDGWRIVALAALDAVTQLTRHLKMTNPQHSAVYRRHANKLRTRIYAQYDKETAQFDTEDAA